MDGRGDTKGEDGKREEEGPTVFDVFCRLKSDPAPQDKKKKERQAATLIIYAYTLDICLDNTIAKHESVKKKLVLCGQRMEHLKLFTG